MISGNVLTSANTSGANVGMSAAPAHNLGVIVGRFQTNILHPGHRSVFDAVTKLHDRVAVFLGVAVIPPSKRNPLDFESRKNLILRECPGATVLWLADVRSDEVWSQALDAAIETVFPHCRPMLYGSRDSFLRYYTGKFDTTELESENKENSATIIREQVANRTLNSPDFLAGIMYAVGNRPDLVYPTVDVALFTRDGDLVLCRKMHEERYRFIGGFVSPRDPTLEAAARREVQEEADVEIDNLRYVASCRVDDWRYKNESDKIQTTLFMADIIYGRLQPKDDICELRTLAPGEVTADMIVPEHQWLLERLLEVRPDLAGAPNDISEKL